MANSNLPSSRDRFVGREALLAELCAALGHGTDRLLTLLGPGGVGKTRLALEVARRAASAYSATGGAWFCDLADARSVRDVASAVGASLGCRVAPRGGDAEAVAQVGRILRARGRVLLVADNFEQIVAHAGDTLGAWLDAADEVALVVTTRRPLGLQGERCFDVGPLDVDEATELFLQRARARARGFAPTEAERDVVATLVRQLECIPLAIELTAARAPLLSPTQMLSELRSRAALPGEPSAPGARHVSVRASVAWSWSLLTTPLREALAACSVFAGGFDLDAARALLGSDAEPRLAGIDALAQLRASSLVYTRVSADDPDENRYDLYVGVAEFAAEQLDALGARAGAARRHAEYFVAAARERGATSGGDDPADDAWIWRERHNLLAVVDRFETTDPALALRAALTVADVVSRRETGPARSALLETIAAIAARVDDAGLRAAAALTRGHGLLHSGLLTVACAELDGALDRAERDGVAAPARGALERVAGIAHALSGERERGLELLQRALATAHAVGDDRLERRALSALSLAQMRIDVEAAATFAQAAVAVAERGRPDPYVAVALNNAGGALFELDRLDEAEHCWSRALALHQARGERLSVALQHGFHGLLHRARGRLDDAAASFEQSLRLHRAMGTRLYEGVMLGELALTRLMAGEIDDAARRFADALLTLGDSGLARHRVIFSAFLAATEALRDRVDVAAERFAALEAHPLVAADPALRMVGVVAGFVDLARARQASQAGDAAEATAHRDAARARLAQSTDAARTSSDARVARGLLGAALAAADREAGRHALEVSRQRRSFRAPEASPAQLATHASLWRLFERLLAEREARPGTPVAVADLVSAAWPGVRMQPQSAINRLYVAVSTLRGSGLRDALCKNDAGYYLDPTVAIRYTD